MYEQKYLFALTSVWFEQLLKVYFFHDSIPLTHRDFNGSLDISDSISRVQFMAAFLMLPLPQARLLLATLYPFSIGYSRMLSIIDSIAWNYLLSSSTV